MDDSAFPAYKAFRNRPDSGLCKYLAQFFFDHVGRKRLDDIIVHARLDRFHDAALLRLGRYHEKRRIL